MIIGRGCGYATSPTWCFLSAFAFVPGVAIEAPCTAQQLARYFLVMCMIICLMPLTVVIRDLAYNTTILGTPYTHVHSAIFQIFELRYAPLAALLLYLASLLVLRYGKSTQLVLSKWFFAYGTGFLSFGFFRMIVYSAYLERQGWYTVWEEMLELLYIGCCLLVIWSFRKRFSYCSLIG